MGNNSKGRWRIRSVLVKGKNIGRKWEIGLYIREVGKAIYEKWAIAREGGRLREVGNPGRRGVGKQEREVGNSGGK